MPDNSTPAEHWPGVQPAQVFVLPSYQWMVARFEAADSRIQTLVTFVTTVTFAVPTLARALRPDLPLNSGWVVGAVAAGVSVVIVGLVARLRGILVLPGPTMFYEKWLGFSESEFQRNALYFAGKHFESNRQTVNRKAVAVAIMGGLFVGELALFLIWAATA
jgi:hypothetical protein